MHLLREFRLLFDESGRKRLVFALVGSVLLALTDAAGVLAILPLMQLLTGSSPDEGPLGTISGLLGHPSVSGLATCLAIFTFGAFAAKGVLSVAFRWWLLGFVSRQETQTSERLLRYYLHAPYGHHLNRNSAELISALNDAARNTYTGQFAVGVVTIASEFCTIVVVGAILILLVPGPALLLLAYFAIAGGVLYRVVRPLTHRAGERMLVAYADIYRGAMHALGGIKEIKIRHKSGYFLRRYRGARAEYAGAQRSAVFFGELPRYIMEILFIFGIGLTTVFVFMTSPSAESIGVLAILAASGFRLLPSAVRLLAAMNIIRFARPSVDLVLSELRGAAAIERAQPATGESRAAEAATAERLDVTSTIALDRVTFTYDGQQEPAVNDVSFSFPVGSTVGIVGPSGSGKSTLVDLLLGLQTPSRGTISVDGQDITTVLPSWQRSLGLVPQDVYLLDGSLRENIAFGVEPGDIDDARLRSAVSEAQLGELVAGLDNGLDSSVGERGARLSGGQRQRIGIARALYTRPELLIFDEATSSLDNETERRISETISNLHGIVTIVMVAHRLSTVRECDQIIFMRDGRLVAVGTFDELQAASDDFARLVDLGRLV